MAAQPRFLPFRWAGAALLALWLGGCGPQGQGPQVAQPVTLGELLAGIDAELLPAEFEQALAELRGAAERVPGDARRLGDLGALLDAHGLYAAAERVYGRAAELDPQDARLRALTAFAQAEQGRLGEALAFLEAAIALAPERAHLRVRRGLWLAEFGRAEEAAQEFARALELAPTESADVLAWARLDLDLGNSAAAEQRLRAHLAAVPGDLPARALLARALTDLGQTEAAAVERALAGPALPSWSDPWKVEVEARAVGYGAVMGAALEALRSGQAEARLADVQRLHAADPDDVTVQGMLTAALTSLGRAGEAIQMLRQAQERQPDHYRIPMNLALALDAAGQTGEALAPAERAAMLHPGLPDAQRLLGRLHSKLEAPALAAAAYQRAVELGDRDAKSMELLAMALRRAGRGPEARPWFLEVAALSPGRARPRAFAALCLAEAGDLATARREFDAAAALEPKEPALGSLGKALAQLEQRSGR